MTDQTQNPFSEHFIPNDTQTAIDSLFEKMNRVKAKRIAFMADQPQSIFCKVHPNIIRPISEDETQRAICDNLGILTAGYEPCPECEMARQLELQREWLLDAGVPSNMTHCTLENWRPGSQEEQKALEWVTKFAAIKVGFLVMLGGFGTGKSHLSVAVLRTIGSGAFIKQNTLLRELRDTYRDRNAIDPVKRLQRARLLVLDEIGVSTGGRDELPTLHEILDYRHGAKMPTILTSNLSANEFKAAVGDRLADRLRESAFKILTFSGQSHRAERKEDYLNLPGEWN